MENSWLLKVSILATALVMFTGCPALSNLMELISRGQEKPRKTLVITGLGEYEGKLMQVVASDSSDALGERLCLSGGSVRDRVVKDSVGKTFLLEMNAGEANTNVSAFAAMAKNMMGIAKPCDDRERVVMLSIFLSDSLEGENQDADALMEKVLDNTFIYTKGVNICAAGEDVLSNIRLTYSFSETEATFKFSDFMRVSDCEILMDIVRSVSKGSEEYIVVKTDSLDVRVAPSFKDSVKAKFAPGEIINVVSPKDTIKTDGYLWIKVYYKGKNKIGWVTEQALPSTIEGTSATASDKSSFASTPAPSMAPSNVAKSPSAPQRTVYGPEPLDMTNFGIKKDITPFPGKKEYYTVVTNDLKILKDINTASAPDNVIKYNSDPETIKKFTKNNVTVSDLKSLYGITIKIYPSVTMRFGEYLWVMAYYDEKKIR